MALQQLGWRRPAALRLESLENRLCLSVTVSTVERHGNNELRITSDDAADVINIADQGDGNIQLTDADGNLLGIGEDIDAIRVTGKGGDDVVSYTLSSPLTRDQQLSILLGGGANQANVDLSQGVDGARLYVNVTGGADADTIVATLGKITDGRASLYLNGASGSDTLTVSGTGVTIVEDSALDLRMEGGRDDDILTTTFDTQVSGWLGLTASGGRGADTLNSEVTVNSGSTGRLFARSDGGADADTVTLNLTDDSTDASDGEVSALAAVHAVIFDPAQEDVVTSTDNVTVIDSYYFFGGIEHGPFGRGGILRGGRPGPLRR